MAKLSPSASPPGAIIKPQWLELPMFQINFHGPKDGRAIEGLLYLQLWRHALDISIGSKTDFFLIYFTDVHKHLTNIHVNT